MITAALLGRGMDAQHSADHIQAHLRLIYLPADPYAVTIQVSLRGPAMGGSISWTVSRETLCLGAIWQTDLGLGDFRVVPLDDATTQLVFHATEPGWDGQGRDSNLHVNVSRKQVLEFVRQTIQAVPPGAESKQVNIDHEIDLMLGRTPR